MRVPQAAARVRRLDRSGISVYGRPIKTVRDTPYNKVPRIVNSITLQDCCRLVCGPIKRLRLNRLAVHRRPEPASAPFRSPAFIILGCSGLLLVWRSLRMFTLGVLPDSANPGVNVRHRYPVSGVSKQPKQPKQPKRPKKPTPPFSPSTPREPTLRGCGPSRRPDGARRR